MTGLVFHIQPAKSFLGRVTFQPRVAGREQDRGRQVDQHQELPLRRVRGEVLHRVHQVVPQLRRLRHQPHHHPERGALHLGGPEAQQLQGAGGQLDPRSRRGPRRRLQGLLRRQEVHREEHRLGRRLLPPLQVAALLQRHPAHQAAWGRPEPAQLLPDHGLGGGAGLRVRIPDTAPVDQRLPHRPRHVRQGVRQSEAGDGAHVLRGGARQGLVHGRLRRSHRQGQHVDPVRHRVLGRGLRRRQAAGGVRQPGQQGDPGLHEQGAQDQVAGGTRDGHIAALSRSLSFIPRSVW